MRKAKPSKRSPVANRSISRQAGETLQKRLDEASSELFYYFGCGFALVVLALLGLVFLQWFRSNPYLFLALQSVVGIVLIYLGIRRWILVGRPLSLGLQGERSVGDTLNQLMEWGYIVIHDVPSKGRPAEANIDHVLVGPAGVFAIETKTVSKPGNSKLRFNGSQVMLGGTPLQGDPISQTKAAARDIAEIIRAETRLAIAVRPTLLFPGWFVEYESSSHKKNHDIWVMSDNYFVKVVKSERAILSNLQITAIAQGLARHSDGVRRHN